MDMFHIPQDALPIELLGPAADAAGRTGTWVSLKNALRAFIVVHITQGNAATVQLDPQQASAVAGTDAKALSNNCQIWHDQDLAAGNVFTRATDAKTFTTSAAVKHKCVVFQIDPALLDVANGFDCITLVTGASNAANITSAMLYVVPRYAEAGAPSYLTD